MGSDDDVNSPLMQDMEAELGTQGDLPTHPRLEQVIGFRESAKRMFMELLSTLNGSRALGTAVDAITLCVLIGSFVALFYLALTGRESGSVCYPSNPGLPELLQALMLIVPWIGLAFGLWFFQLHRDQGAPFCSFSTITLLQTYVMVVMSVWLVGCLSEVNMKMCFVVAVAFGGIATVLWAWSHGCAKVLVETVMGRTGRRDNTAALLE